MLGVERDGRVCLLWRAQLPSSASHGMACCQQVTVQVFSEVPAWRVSRMRCWPGSKAEVSVARLVEGCGVELRAQGKDLVGRCPFHDDGTPSLVVTPGKNLWNCLGACGRGGGPIDWVMAAQGVSFRLAVELLIAESPSLSVLAQSSPLAAGAGPVSKSVTRKLPLLADPAVDDAALAAAVVDHYAATLGLSPEALGYLGKRGVDHPEAIGTFRIGYANRTLGYRLGHSQTKAGGTLRARLQSLGFVRASGHEHFTGSLVVPIFTGDGAVGEVYGRKIAEHGLRAGTPTHLYLPGPHAGVFNAAGLIESGGRGAGRVRVGD